MMNLYRREVPCRHFGGVAGSVFYGRGIMGNFDDGKAYPEDPCFSFLPFWPMWRRP